MSEKRSFQEIVSKQLWGIWYSHTFDTFVECQNEFLEITGLPRQRQSNFYIQDTTEKTFVKAKYMEFKDAVKELVENKSVVISPLIPPHEQTKYKPLENLEIKAIGLNIFELLEDGKIRMNKKKIFTSFDEVLKLDIISEEEKRDEWLVF